MDATVLKMIVSKPQHNVLWTMKNILQLNQVARIFLSSNFISLRLSAKPFKMFSERAIQKFPETVIKKRTSFLTPPLCQPHNEFLTKIQVHNWKIVL